MRADDYDGANVCQVITIVSVALVFSTMSQCTAGQPVAPLPQLNWEMAEINATEGSIEITCFTSDSGSTEPYQVSVNSRGKGINPATRGGDYIILSLLNFTIRASESTGVRRCVSFRPMDDNIALQEVEQFELYFENLPSNFATVGDQSTLCVNIMDDDVITIDFETPAITVQEGGQTPTAATVPTIEWMEREIVVFEGESRLVCFSADIGTALPYQVIVGVNGKGERPASEADFVVHTPLSFVVPVNDKGEQFCLTLSIVDDILGEDSEQFVVYFENITSELATVGANDTICITIQENDAVDFDFCLLGCGTLSEQLNEIYSFLEGNTMLLPEIITFVIQRLSQFIEDTVSSPIDHTVENLNLTAAILTIIAEQVESQTIVDDIIIEAATEIIDSLLQWDQAAIDAQASSTIIESFEVITSVNAQHLLSLGVSLPFVTLNTQLISLNELQEEGRIFEINDSEETSSNAGIPISISLPPSLFKQISETDTNSTGLVFTVYRKSTLFPVGERALSSSSASMAGEITEVGTDIIAANVGRDAEFENLQDPVTIILRLESQNNVSGNVRCVSWDFDLVDWATSGCTTEVGQNGTDTVTCSCNHLTNFAALVDICLRQDGCEPINPIIGTLLTFISYIGIIISIVGLVLTIITILTFKKLRRKDFAEHHVQFCIALLLMLIVSLILISLNSETAANVLHGGCMTVSVLLHYFALVAVMWMGAEALLMFRKVVIVFVRITTKYILAVSLACWLVPVVPVLVSLIAELSNGDDPANDIIIRRASTRGESLCFLSHVGAFWGAFLAPILLVMVFNLVLFIWVIVVMVQHIRRKTVHTKNKLAIGPRKVIEIIIRLSGVMFLFGLTWLFAILTVASVPGLRETFQILFTVSNSFQGAFIFLFFCLLNQEARESWKSIIHKLLQSSNVSQMDLTRSTKLNSGSQEYSLSSSYSSGAHSMATSKPLHAT